MLPLAVCQRSWERRRRDGTVEALRAALADELPAQRWSANELAVLRRAARGDTNPKIAAELGIGLATVGRVLRRFASFGGDARPVGAADPRRLPRAPM